MQIYFKGSMKVTNAFLLFLIKTLNIIMITINFIFNFKYSSYESA